MYRGIVLLISYLFLSVSALSDSKSDTLRKLLLERDEKVHSEVLLKLQEHYFYQNLDSALHYGYLALGKAEVFEQETERLRAVVGLGLAYFLQGNQENCDHYWQQADSIIAKASKIDTKTYYHYYKGIIHLYKSRLDSSFFHFNKTIRLARESNNTKLWVRSLQNSGNVFFYKGQFTLALKYYKESNAAADSCNDKRVKVYSTFNIANIYRRKTEFMKSQKWFREAKGIASQINDYNLMGNISNNKALNHMVLNEFDSALVECNNAVLNYRLVGNSKSLSQSMVNMGRIYLAMKDYDQAANYLNKAEASLDKNNIQELVNLKTRQSRLYQAKRNYNRAYDLINEAYDIAKQSKLTDIELECLDCIINLMKVKGDIANAFKFSEQARVLQDSLYDHNKTSQMTFLQTTYELDRKEHENEVLRAKNELSNLEIKAKDHKLTTLFLSVGGLLVMMMVSWVFMLVYRRKKRQAVCYSKQLSKATAMKDQLFQVIGHDLKAPIATISGMADLLGTKDEVIKNEAGLLVNSISDSANILLSFIDNMLYWNKQLNGKLVVTQSEINVNQFMGDIKDWYHSVSSVKSVALSLEGGKELTIQTDRNILQTIIRNLIGNAIKYSYSGDGVKIIWRKEEDAVVIEVVDYGIGMSPEQLKLVNANEVPFSRNGTSGESGTGLGLYISKQLVQSINGSLEIKSELKKGTSVMIRI